MSARTPFTFTDNPGFDYDAGSNEGHLLDMNTTGSSLEGGAKPRKVGYRLSKVKQEQFKTPKKTKKVEKRKQSRMLIGKLEEIKLELEKAEQMLREISLNTDG
ncbi:hypothetical protein A1F99_136630 [Pyrenophora tritici-repentis]|uniref:Uncharacterized protein n=1 Tax=Pyrenophora tritici-repentis TaxID=45151 RepID=A0A2W1D9W3_9PLEO|nr:hypothetical protein A1F99_136630 [Pyrenophora tritici-repentis]KAI1507364.1 hypothetical protein Ptr86124_013686 [Pyrenophora tritici-repentis]KAI1523964.1 hypothetical protein PtrSN001A_011073 [Pyrenophora tritici-repentis]KAI1570855.1 hypothetical protein PtrEW13061_011445 [Pyrenophora tritici-repentis]KAI1676501.1 hypothetical protein KJE20_13927 [Pyrenophora tritici-repentis]